MVNNETNHQEMMLNGNYNVTEDNLEIVEDIEESIRNEMIVMMIVVMIYIFFMFVTNKFKK